MKRFFYLTLTLVFALTACNNYARQAVVHDQEETKPQYYYILEVSQKGEAYYASIQPIDFLYGDEALERAKEHGIDITYGLPNDYYIDDSSEEVIVHKISFSVEVISWAYSDMLGMYKMIYFGSDSFVKFYESRGGFEEIPFVLEFEDNKIEKIQEEYVP
ncbi:MAG: hypothetical protein GX879_01055 [Bacteroidales bacterium]|nr:hypothetical protein [Bacteroidales bacterium]